ncbi:MAG TPA: aminopeptidase [Gaiellaceae bacterium]|nr:aminopeptidase [Gaiellaceae bacterium]
MDRDSSLARLADLAVTLGANVQPGQIVTVGADHGQHALARAIADSAYRRGARFVDVQYFDPYVKRARIAHAPDDTLAYVPPWFSHRMLAIGTERAARISLAGPSVTGLLDDLDPARAGRDQLPFIKEILDVINERTSNWTVVPCPSPAWAELAYPDLAGDGALDRLWEEVSHVCRLDEPDPIAAWNERADELSAAAGRLNDRRFDALHFEGPGTDLTVGLLATSTFHAARDETVDGIVHLANLPTEEVYATPDPERTQGVVRSTKPLVLGDGTIIRGLRVRFEQGRAVEIDADQGAAVMRGRAAFDDGACRLGEVALVDREGRIGRLGTVFFDTLLDENAASHIALGDGSDEGLSDEDRKRRNRSSIHIDFMIGSDDVAVTGITRDGERVPVLRDGSWQI